MGVVMITCPNTGRAVPTGIETDALSFASLPDVPTQTKCPVCGSVPGGSAKRGLLSMAVTDLPPERNDAANGSVYSRDFA
jgi:hypothetical protein